MESASMDSDRARFYGAFVTNSNQESAMNAAAMQLRSVILAKEDGAFIGDEREVLQIVGVSRTTLRQIARLLEREGLLAVRRGANGGYYARRPSSSSVEAAVIDHLEVLHIRTDELTMMAAIVWIEAIRQAACLRTPAAAAVAAKLSKAVRGIGADLSYGDLLTTEATIRSAIFELIDSPYARFVFQTTVRFGERRSKRDGVPPSQAPMLAEFVAKWRNTKLLELDAIAQGDEELAILAATRSRDLFKIVSRSQAPAPD